MMIAVTLFCAAAGWFAAKLSAAQRRAAEVARIRGLGGIVYYDYEMLGTPIGCWNMAAKPPGPNLLRNIFGVDFYADVAYLYAPSSVMQGSPRTTEINDEDLAAIAKFQRLGLLVLDNATITDGGVQRLGGLTGLVQLSLANTAITDAALPTIGRLSSLEYLDLRGTKVTKSGLCFLRNLTKLKRIELAGTQADGLSAADLKPPNLETPAPIWPADAVP